MYASTTRRKRAIRNIIFLIIILIGVMVILINLTIEETISKEKAIDEFRDAMKVVRVERENKQKVIPLNSDAISMCVGGKKVIIINGIIYYEGTVNTWDDIEGVNCEE